MTDPAAEAAFTRMLEELPPSSLTIHHAFVLGWEARGREAPQPPRLIDRDELPDPEKQ